MGRWVVGVVLLSGCFGPPEPSAPELPVAPPTTRVADKAAALPTSTATRVVPEGLLEVRFDAGGLRVIPPGGEPILLAPAKVGETITPDGMPWFGAGLPALSDWCMANLPQGGEPREVVVAVPGTARFAVLKAILRTLFERADARTAHLVVQDGAGLERSIELPYPEVYADPDTAPAVLKVLMDKRGVTLEGLRDTAARDRRSYFCEPECAGPETYRLGDVGRLAYRVHARHDVDHIFVVPHSDVRVDVVVGVLDWTRDDTHLNNIGEEMFPVQILAGTRTFASTPAEQAETLRARLEAAKLGLQGPEPAAEGAGPATKTVDTDAP